MTAMTVLICLCPFSRVDIVLLGTRTTTKHWVRCEETHGLCVPVCSHNVLGSHTTRTHRHPVEGQ